jgi:hypothetical protein
MPKRLIALNLFFGAFGVVFGLLLVREIAFPRPLPPPPELQALRAAPAPAPAKPAGEDFSAYGVIVSRHLFNPARSGATVVTAGAVSSEGRLFLYGVVVDGVQTRAYLSHPVTRRISGYQVGDTVAGWQVQRIGEDRVIMASPEGGSIEVMLRDPSKPQSAASPPPSPIQQQTQPAAQPLQGPSAPGERVAPRTEATRAEPAPPLPQGLPPQLFRPMPAPGQAR